MRGMEPMDRWPLTKKGRFTGRVRRRWVEIDGSLLVYFRARGAVRPRGVIPLAGATLHALGSGNCLQICLSSQRTAVLHLHGASGSVRDAILSQLCDGGATMGDPVAEPCSASAYYEGRDARILITKQGRLTKRIRRRWATLSAAGELEIRKSRRSQRPCGAVILRGAHIEPFERPLHRCHRSAHLHKKCVQVWLPSRGGRPPLVVHSHGPHDVDVANVLQHAVSGNIESLPCSPLSSPRASSSPWSSSSLCVKDVNVNLEPKAKHISPAEVDLLRVLGRGAFGKVVLGRHRESGELYAIKSSAELQHVRAEAAALQTAGEHPRIVRLYGVEEGVKEGEKHRLVLQYCSGGDLYFHLRRKGRFRSDEVAFLARQAAEALMYLHGCGILLRDLKPENILLDAEGNVILGDLGLATMETRSSFVCGSPDYMAPEMLKRSEYGEALDWWTLGCLIFELLVGAPPFSSRSRSRLQQRIATRDVRFPSFLDAEAVSLLDSLLCIDPEQRITGVAVLDHPFLLNAPNDPPFVPSKAECNFASVFTDEPVWSPPSPSYDGEGVEVTKLLL